VTGAGGTYLCTDPVTGTGVDSTDPPVNCQSNPGVREVGWIASGGGFSHVFPTPSYQGTLPAGSTAIGATRGVPDVAYQASSRTGVLVYDTAPGFATGGLGCPSGNPCSAGSPRSSPVLVRRSPAWLSGARRRRAWASRHARRRAS
jgi:hypothetical protein